MTESDRFVHVHTRPQVARVLDLVRPKKTSFQSLFGSLLGQKTSLCLADWPWLNIAVSVMSFKCKSKPKKWHDKTRYYRISDDVYIDIDIIIKMLPLPTG